MKKVEESNSRTLRFLGVIKMCNDIVVQILNNYLSETEDLDSCALSDHQFKDLSIMRWVTSELANLIFDHPFTDAAEIIDEFALKMIGFRANAEGRKDERIFAIAADCAFEWEEILFRR